MTLAVAESATCCHFRNWEGPSGASFRDGVKFADRSSHDRSAAHLDRCPEAAAAIAVVARRRPRLSWRSHGLIRAASHRPGDRRGGQAGRAPRSSSLAWCSYSVSCSSAWPSRPYSSWFCTAFGDPQLLRYSWTTRCSARNGEAVMVELVLTEPQLARLRAGVTIGSAESAALAA